MHIIAAIILFLFLSALLALFIGGLLRAASDDMPQRSDIEPHDFEDETNCAWCMKEHAIKSHPNQSHGICERHKSEMLADARRISRTA